MSLFLLTFNRATSVAEVCEINDRDDALRQLFAAEDKVRSDRNIEVVMLAAEDEDDLRRTHSHYFAPSLDDLLQAV